MRNDEALQTQRFLNLVARRLSSRDDCARVEYVVGIGRSVLLSTVYPGDIFNDERYIRMEPEKKVFPDRQHRKETDSCDIVEYTIKKHYPELITGVDDKGRICYDTSRFTLGVYQYQNSANFKKRRWVRIGD